MKKAIGALTVASVLLLPVAPVRAGTTTFVFSIPAPVLLIVEGPLDAPTGVACIGTGGQDHPWLAANAEGVPPNAVFTGFFGLDTKKFKDNTVKTKLSASDATKNASTDTIRLWTDDTGNDPDRGEVVNAKAKMKMKVKKYVVDSMTGLGSSGTLKASGSGTPVQLTGIADKLTTGAPCDIKFDVETARPVSVSVRGTTGDGRQVRVNLGR